MQECVLLAFVPDWLYVPTSGRRPLHYTIVLIDFVVQYCTAHTQVLLLCHGV